MAVINYKGGVGKTTVVANMAAGFARDGYKVLMIDLDPQASLTFSFMHPYDWKQKYRQTKTIKNWYDDYFNKKPRDLKNYFIKELEVNELLTQPLTLVASHTDLYEVQIELAQGLGGKFKRKQSTNKLQILSLLAEEIEKIKDEFDLVLIDCQPSFDISTQSAIIASDYYIIPTRLDFLSTVGVDTLDGHIKRLLHELNSNIDRFNMNREKIKVKPLGLVSTMVEFGKTGLISANKEYDGHMKQLKDIKMFESKIRFNQTSLGGSSNIPLILGKGSSESEKKVISDFNKLLDEMKERIDSRNVNK
ncbi:MAG: AAA family ATPase [Cellulosilyticaceae bacterium]